MDSPAKKPAPGGGAGAERRHTFVLQLRITTPHYGHLILQMVVYALKGHFNTIPFSGYNTAGQSRNFGGAGTSNTRCALVSRLMQTILLQFLAAQLLMVAKLVQLLGGYSY